MPKKKKITVTKSFLPNIDKYKSYVDEIFKTGWLTNHGPLVKLLEERLTEHLGVNNLILVANGTLALQLAFKALSLKGEVITTPFTFIATTSSLVWSGLKPRFADIDKETFCMDPKKIEEMITPETSAILPVHVFGNTCDLEKIQEIADRYRLKLIYDAAHSFGVQYKNKSVLEHGDISILSFHATKIFHTCEGGALIIKDDAVFEKAKKMVDFGITSSEVIEELGVNAKMNEFEGAMGLCVLDDISGILTNREKIFRYYLDNLPKTIRFQKLNEFHDYNYSYFPVIFSSGDQRAKVQAELNNKGIFPRRYFHPSLDSLCYLQETQAMPVSRGISERILCLPLYSGLDTTDVDMIIEVVEKITLSD